ncbi:MAG: hypothetical protein ACLUO6_04865 [Ruminococcus sp.]
MNIGIDHGYYAIETRHFSFLAGIAVYSHEPYTLQNTLEYGVPNASTCRSLELGMIRCIDETKEQVRRDVGVSVTDAQVERVLGGGAPVVKGNMSPQDGLCRVFALIDNRVNAEEFERILGQFSGGLSRG